MNRIRRFCSHEQHLILDRIHRLMQDFYLSNDNSVTYALTGLLSKIRNSAEFGLSRPSGRGLYHE